MINQPPGLPTTQPSSASNLLTGFMPLLTGGSGGPSQPAMYNPYAMPPFGGFNPGGQYSFLPPPPGMGTGAGQPAAAMPPGLAPQPGTTGALPGDLSGYGQTANAMTALPAALSTGAVPPAPGLPGSTPAPAQAAPQPQQPAPGPAFQTGALQAMGYQPGPAAYWGATATSPVNLSQYLFPTSGTGQVYDTQTGQFVSNWLQSAPQAAPGAVASGLPTQASRREVGL